MYLESDGYYSNSKAFGPLGTDPANPVDPAFVGISNQGDGRDLGGDDLFSGRFKVLWQPTDNFNALFQYEMVRDDGDTPPIVNESPSVYLLPLWGYPAATGDPIDSAGVFFRSDSSTVGVNTAAGHQVDIDGIYLNWEWGITDTLSIVGNAGYREQESRLPSTYTGEVGPVSLFDATRDDDRETTQIEARLVTSFDGPLNFTAGVYYQEDDTDFCVLQIVGFLDNFFLGTPSQFFNDNPVILCNAQEADSLAGYIDGTYEFTDRLSVTAGFRLTQEDKSWVGRPRIGLDLLDGVAGNGFPTLADLGEPLGATDFDTYSTGVVRDEEDWSEPTYRLTFGYDFNDDLYGYIGYARGFKSGGYNDQIGTQLNPIVPAAARPTEPEIADSYEAGIRATLADGSADVGITGYWVEYSDAQRTLNATFPTGQETLFFNAAELEVFGLELEGRWEVVDNLVLTGNAAVTDAEFNEFQADTDFDGMIDVDLSGNPVQRVPDWMATLDGTYTHDLGGDRGSLALNARLSYEDESIFSYSSVDPQFDTTLQSRVLIDAAVTWTSADDRWWVSAYGKNLTDDRYRTASLNVANIWVMSAYAPPRWFGVELGANFDW